MYQLRGGILFFLVTSSLLLAVAACSYFEVAHHFLNSGTEKTVRWSFLVKNTGSDVIESAHFSTYAPVKFTSTQDLLDLSSNYSFDLISDRYQNQVMNFSLGMMPPFSEKVVTITAKVRLYKYPRFSILRGKEAFLIEEPFIELNNPRLQAKAKELNSFFKFETIQNIFEWVNRYIKPIGFVSDDRGASYALKYKVGDCTEYMYLFIALSRLADVPARGVGGWFFDDANQILKASEYHNWAQYFDRGRWRLADAQNRVLDDKNTSYLAFRIFGQDEVSPMNNTHRFVSFSENLLVRMN